MDDDDVEGIARQRQVVDVALPHAAMLAGRRGRAGARKRQHVGRQVDAEAALDLRPEQFEHAPGAGAEIEQRAERPVGSAARIAASTGVVGDMQLADAVPLGGMAREIGLRRRGPGGAHAGEPLAVARDGRVGGVEPRRPGARDQLGAGAVLGEAEEGPGALAEALHQPGLGQQLEMARDARLRLAQDVGEIRDRQLGLGEQRQDAQPRLLARRLEGGVEVVEGECCGVVMVGWFPIGVAPT